MQGAGERRLRRTNSKPQGDANEGNQADDALMTGQGLFVVFMPPKNCKCPVNLFSKYEPDHFMCQGHFRYRHNMVGPEEDILRQSQGAPYYKANPAFILDRQFFKHGGK